MNVEMPDGTIIEDVPDGTTQAEVMRRYSAKQATPPAIDTKTRRVQEVSEWKPPTAAGYALNEAGRGLAGTLGFVGDVSNLGATGTMLDPIKASLRALGFLPQNTGKFGDVSDRLKELIGVKNLTPPSAAAKIGGTIASNVASAIPFAGWAGRAGKVAPVVTELAAGLGAGVGATVAQEASPGSKAAEIVGQVAGSILPYRAGGVVNQVAGAYRDREALGQKLRGQADKVTEAGARATAGREIERALAPYDPNDISKRVSVYQQLREKYPGIKIGAGEITENDPLLSMQREAAGRSVESLAEAGARSRENLRITEAARNTAVPRAGKSLQTAVQGQRKLFDKSQQQIEDNLSAVVSEETARREAITARALPQTEAGEALAGVRSAELSKSRATAQKKYGEFRVSLGEQADTPAEATSILDEISALRAEDPASQRMPSLFTAVKGLSKPGEKTPVILGPEGQPLTGGQGPNTLTLNDLLSIQKAVGKDVRTNMLRQPPDRELTRRLLALDKEVTRSIQDNAPSSALPLYDEARRFYREEHVPRFFKGANYKQALPDAYGDLRIRPEKVVSTYLNSPSNAVRFNQLYGESDKAKAALYGGTLDLYRQEVLAGGKTHESFMRKYEGSLSKLPWLNDAMKTEGNAFSALANQQKLLRDNAADIAKTRLAQVLKKDTPDAVLDEAMKSPQNMGNFIVKMSKEDRGAVVTAMMDRGFNILKESGSEAFERWMRNNQNTVKTAMFGAHGKKAATAYMENIADVIQLTKYVERSPIQKIDVGAIRMADDPIREKLGFSTASVFAALRGIAQKRVSPHFAGGVFAGQFVTNITKQKYYDMLRQVLYEPETLNAFVNSAKTGNPADMKEWTSRMSDLAHSILGREVPKNLLKKTPTYGQQTEEPEEQ